MYIILCCLSTQLEGLIGVHVQPCSYVRVKNSDSQRPTVFRNWWHPLARVRLAFRSAPFVQKAKARSEPLYIWDGDTVDRSSMAVRVTFEEEQERMGAAVTPWEEQARATAYEGVEHVEIAGFQKWSIAAAEAIYGTVASNPDVLRTFLHQSLSVIHRGALEHNALRCRSEERLRALSR